MQPKNRNRAMALGFFAFVSVVAVVVWTMVRSYGAVYFFPVHFLVGLGLPFLLYALGGTRIAFHIGLAVSLFALVLLNVWGNQLAGLAPRVFDWAHLFAGVIGVALAWVAFYVYSKVVPRHAPTSRR